MLRCSGFLILICFAFCHAEDDALRIGSRSKTAAAEPTPEDFDKVIQKIQKAGPAETLKDATDAALALIAQVKVNPDLFTRLLIPPGFPRAIGKADKEIRVRTATILGLSRDRRALNSLVNSSVFDPEDSVRLASAKALPQLDEPLAIRKLVDIAISGDRQKYPWAARQSACRAIKRYGDKEAIERMLRELSFELAGGNPLDRHNNVRGKGSGIGTENPLGVPEPVPEGNIPEHDMYPVLSAIKVVTGQNFDRGEKDVKIWLQWWNKDGAKFVFKE